MSLLFDFLVAGLLGAIILGLFGLRLKAGEFAAFAFGVGSSAITLGVFGATAAFNTAFSASTVIAVVFALCLFFLPLTIWRAARSEQPIFPKFLEKPALPSGLDFGLAVCVVLLIAYAALIALYWPPWTWDAMAIWVVKAKAIFQSRSLNGHLEGAYPFYPLHVPLQLAILRLNSPEPPTQILFPVYLASLLLVVKNGLERFGQKRSVLFFLLLLAATPILLTYSSTAYADLPYTFYYVSSVLCLLAFFDGQQVAFACLSGLLAGITAWTRPEGALSFVINYVVLLAYLARVRSAPAVMAAFIYPITFSIFWAPWTYYTRIHGYGSYVTEAAVSTLYDLANLRFSVERLTVVLKYFQAQWISFNVWGSVWILFGLSLLRWRAIRQNGWLVAVILLNIAGLLFTYYATPGDSRLQWWLETGFQRMALHFLPLLWVYIGLAWGKELSEAAQWYAGRVQIFFDRALAQR